MGTLIKGEWSHYRSGHFNGGKMVMLQRWSNGGRMVMLLRWPVSWRENGHLTEVVTNGGRMVKLQTWKV